MLRHVKKSGGLPALLLCFVLCGLCGMIGARPARTGEKPRRDRPNIIFILADDLGYAELGCYGQKKIRTPGIDRLAAGGMRFTQFYSGSPVCAPSRCVLITGRHSGHAHVRNNSEVQPEGQRPIPASAVTIAELLKGRGYATAATGKWGLGFPGSEGDPNKQGFDLFFGYNCQRHAHNHYPRYLRRNDQVVNLEGNDAGLTGKQFSHDLMEAEALRFIQGNRERPFFLYVPFTIPHLALQVPEDSLAEYRGMWEDPPYEGGKGYLPHPHPRAAYAAMVTRIDRSVGRIMDLVAKLGLEEETLVMFSSDNGPTYDRLGGTDSGFFESAGPLRGFKGSVYEGGIRVPLVARWPGRIRPGATSDLPAAFWDVLPTLCQVAGMETPEDTDGISFLPTLRGKEQERKHGYLYWEFPAYGGQQAVRMGDWKGVRQNLMKGESKTELYHLGRDTGEKENVAAQHPEVVRRIEKIMKESHTPSPLFPFPALDKTVE
jgi:arylsulfatase A-like enzyme